MLQGMRIRDITVADIGQGKNWKVKSTEDFDWENDPLEDLSIVDASDFEPEDEIVYSALYVTHNGEVQPLVLIKAVEDSDYGGDYCEFVNGKWRQVGLVPDPSALPGTEFIANPLEYDESFISEDDYRAHHREGFQKYKQGLLAQT
jgi:hypothetical protein